MNHDLDKILLPLSSRNQELETISMRIFEPLFDVDKFILKNENIDNGIDYRCEIKHNGKVLGFGFNFQLKSKEDSKPNTDGSYSKSLKTSNIEYLLNNGQPAFYGFYVAEKDTFYYEHLDEFISNLNKENPNWQDQTYHTLRFTKKIDKTSVGLIYDIVLKKGILFRKLNATLAVRFSQANLGEKVLIDYDGNVSTDEEIKDIIEKYGFELINQCKWNKILELHRKSSNGLNASAMYNMIIGLANYYLGEYIIASGFFINALKQKQDLNLELLNHLIFIDATIKYLLQIFTKTEYENTLKNLPEDNHINHHIQIENAIEDLKNKLFQTQGLRVSEFEESIQAIIDNVDASIHVKLRAKCELLIYEGKIALQTYKNIVCRINAYEESIEVNLKLRKKSTELLEKEFNKIEVNYTELYNEANLHNDNFTFFYLFTNKIKYDFEKYSSFEILRIVNNPVKKNDFSIIYEELLKNIDKATDYFKSLGHIENTLFSQSIKYEILHYLKRFEEADYLILFMEETVDLLDIKKLKKQVNFIKEGGTNHQMLQNIIDEKINKPKKEIEELIIDLKKMDSQEEFINVDFKDSYQVNLFPIGHFLIPKEKINIFFNVFNIKEEKLISHFNFFFNSGIVPVVNTYLFPVIQEGYSKGNLENIDFKNFKNMYNSRKAFFENKFYRIKSK